MSIRTRKFSQFVVGGDTQAGDIVVGLRNGQNYQFNAPTGGNGSGSIVTITQPNHGLSPQDWVYIDTAGLFQKADSTTDVKAEVEGVVIRLDATDPVNKFVLQTEGFVDEGVFTGLTVGPAYFLSANNPGQMTLVENLENGQVRLPLFVAYTDKTGFIRQFDGIINNGQQQVFSDLPDGGDGQPVIELITQNGHGFSIGQALYNDSANHYALALADGVTPGREKAVGFVAAVPAPTLNTFYLQQSGFMAGFIAPVAPLVPATQYWLSTTTPGALQTIEPTTIGHWKKPMLQATNTTAGWILPQLPLEITAANTNPILLTVNQPAHGFLYNGLVVKPQTGGGNLGKYEAAISSNLTGSLGVGMIEIIDADNFIVQEVGYFNKMDTVPPVAGGIVNPAYPLTNGVPYYLSAANAGQITTVEPANPFYSKPIFSADQLNAGWILPMKPTLVGGGGGGGGRGIIQCIAYEDHEQHGVSYGNADFTSIPFLTAIITPTSITSKIRLTFCVSVDQQYSSYYTVYRDGVRLQPDRSMCYQGPTNGLAQGLALKTFTFMYIDTPASIAMLTYNLRIISALPIGPVNAIFNGGGPTLVTSWTIEEIGV